MPRLQKNVSLKSNNTFGIDVTADKLIAIQTIDDLIQIIQSENLNQNAFFILGGGSNVLFTKNIDQIVLKNELLGIHVLEETDDYVKLRVASGENWHQFVLHCVSKGWPGLENLSLIPGSIGAAPIQNIGAYGVEIKDAISQVNFVDILSAEEHYLVAEECRFRYRDSIFKHELKGKVFITSVDFHLTKNKELNISYGAIAETLERKGILNPSINDLSNAVIEIRQRKLPDPKVLGNGGSFFKNPIIPLDQLDQLKKRYEDIKYYTIDKNEVKIPAAWLIEKSGWKGKKVGNTGSHKNQALVLVNYGNATGKEIYDLALEIIDSVFENFGIKLTPEVNVL